MKILTQLAAVVAIATFAAPADARRTAIDTLGVDENGNDIQVRFTLGGYCDLNGDDCGGEGLGYSVKFGSGELVDRVFVHGNGLISFGSAVDFTAVPRPEENSEDLLTIISSGRDPALSDYGINLVSVGQNNGLDVEDPSVFYQSAKVDIGSGGKIVAEWFTCVTPTSSTSCPSLGRQFLTLTPRRSGYFAQFGGAQIGVGPGYVINGVTTAAPYGESFFIPAEFTGLGILPGVPEPASWAMMIVGFGLTGAALRRRRLAQAS